MRSRPKFIPFAARVWDATHTLRTPPIDCADLMYKGEIMFDRGGDIVTNISTK